MVEGYNRGSGRGGRSSSGPGGRGGSRGGRSSEGGPSRPGQRRPRMAPRKVNRFILPEGERIEYKNLNLLQKFVTDRGKILPRRISGVSAREQRQLAAAVQQARFIALLPVGAANRK